MRWDDGCGSFDSGEDSPNILLDRVSVSIAVVDAVEGEVRRGNLVEDHGVGRATEAEHAQKVSLIDALALTDELMDAGHFSHTDLDHTDATDLGVVGLDDVDLTDGGHGEEGL
jgi:hypothetical protein